MSFADNLQYLRKKNKITQEELAEELNVSRQSVSKWETGEAYPETEKLITLCDRFNVTLDDLLRGDVKEGKTDNEEQSFETQTSADIENNDDATVKEEERKKRITAIGASICSGVFAVCGIIYLCLGLTLGLWHPTWLIFLGGVLVCIWAGGMTDGNPEGKSLKERIGGFVCGTVMVSALIIFLIFGFVLKIWHPTWVVFIIGAGICGVIGALTNKKQ
ncbi:MAG: helix-turn-helix domain-containing protein [Candidatus Coproplasma sp.]